VDKFKIVCAAQLGGSLGMQLWGVAQNGDLFSTFQNRPNGPWEKWSQWAGQGILGLAAAPNGRGEVSLWALVDGFIFATSQKSVGDVNWGWSKPGPAYDPSRAGDPPGGWRSPGGIPMRLAEICACEPSYKGTSGRQLWAFGRDLRLYSTYETNRLDGGWCPWKSWEQPQVEKHQFFSSLTAAQNGQGEVSLWALYEDGVLHCRSQIKAGETWGAWVKGWSPVGPFGTPTPVKFSTIWACRQGGSLGRALWGVAKGNGELYWTYEKVAAGGGWTGWEKFPGPGDAVTNLTAVRRKDGRVALWAYSWKSNVLYNNVQRVAGGDKWAGWDRGGTRQEDFGIIDEIETILALKPDGNRNVTYLRTSGNKFTRLDTPGLWGQGSKATGRGSEACNKLLGKITNVIASATQRLDLTFLYLPDKDPKVSAFPDGDFQKAISEGFEKFCTLGRSRSPFPSIRILFGVPLGGIWRKVYDKLTPPVGKLMENERTWLEETIERTKKYKRIHMRSSIQVAWGGSGSWNHTKIIVADDKIAITGGHNFWDDDYFGAPPTHDVSGIFEGPAAKAARLFCDKLWENRDRKYSFSLINGNFSDGTKDEPPKPILNAGTPGHLEMLSLGRLGKGLANFSISSNAGVTARIVALCKAKNDIKISQQSLRSLTPLLKSLPPPIYDFYTCLAIVRAVRAGVNIKIVLSGQQGKGYGGEAEKVLGFLQLLYLLDVLPPNSIPDTPLPPPVDPGGPIGPPPSALILNNRYYSAKCHAAPTRREDVDKWVDLAAGVGQNPRPIAGESEFDLALLPSRDRDRVYAKFRTEMNVNAHIAELNSKLKLATLYYADNSQSSNHSKVYIIDEDCFYVGSDNMYPSADIEGLQEFGYLIEDKKETQKFISEYWENLWKYSGPRALNN
jgi:phosphatidylserine/phosphatidylglycerophosphate/cardiolipin synthase-like enzyme